MERREASASRWTRAAPRQAWTVARHERDNRQLAPFGAPLAPRGADGKEESKTRAQQHAAGVKKTALFDIVNRNYAATRSVPPSARRAASSCETADTRRNLSSALILRSAHITDVPTT